MNDINHILSELINNVGHDAQAADMIGKLKKHLDTNSLRIEFEKGINDRVANTYSFEFAEAKAPKAVNNYFDALNIAIAQLAYVLRMAEQAGCAPEEIEHLKVRIEQGSSQTPDEKLLTLVVPTVEMVESQTNKTLEYAVTASKVMDKVLSNVPKFNHSTSETLLASHKARLQRNYEVISAYNADTEAAYTLDLANKIDVEKQRLNDFRETGAIDQTVEVSPIFKFYEDQLLYNIHTLEAAYALGTPAHQAMLRAQRDNETLKAEIIELETALGIYQPNT